MDVLDVAGELYALPPQEFTAARDDRARRARADGEKDAAQQVRRFARPTASAWVVNALVRGDPDLLEELLALGAALREAQDATGEHVRRLTARRREMLAAAVSRARALAEQRGQPVSRATADEVEATLRSAVADVGAARAVRSGRLTRALAASGLGDVDVSGAVALPESLPPAPAPLRTVGAPKQPERSEESEESAAPVGPVGAASRRGRAGTRRGGAGQAPAAPTRTERTRTERTRTERTSADEGRQAEPEQTEPDQTEPDQTEPEQIERERAEREALYRAAAGAATDRDEAADADAAAAARLEELRERVRAARRELRDLEQQVAAAAAAARAAREEHRRAARAARTAERAAGRAGDPPPGRKR